MWQERDVCDMHVVKQHLHVKLSLVLHIIDFFESLETLDLIDDTSLSFSSAFWSTLRGNFSGLDLFHLLAILFCPINLQLKIYNKGLDSEFTSNISKRQLANA